MKFQLLRSSLGEPVQIKFTSSLAYGTARQQSTENNSTKPPSKNCLGSSFKPHDRITILKLSAHQRRESYPG
jgi:hypothetical protein